MVIIRWLAAFMVAFLCASACEAKECAPDTELDAEIIRIDADGKVEMRANLDKLIAARGMSQEESVVYLKALMLRKDLRFAQAMRDAMVSDLVRAINSERCADITRAKKNARGVIVAEWKAVNELIERDISAALIR